MFLFMDFATEIPEFSGILMSNKHQIIGMLIDLIKSVHGSAALGFNANIIKKLKMRFNDFTCYRFVINNDAVNAFCF